MSEARKREVEETRRTRSRGAGFGVSLLPRLRVSATFLSHPVRIVSVMEHDQSQQSILHIDCDQCVMQHTTACDDCLVSVVLQLSGASNAVAFDHVGPTEEPDGVR